MFIKNKYQESNNHPIKLYILLSSITFSNTCFFYQPKVFKQTMFFFYRITLFVIEMYHAYHVIILFNYLNWIETFSSSQFYLLFTSVFFLSNSFFHQMYSFYQAKISLSTFNIFIQQSYSKQEIFLLSKIYVSFNNLQYNVSIL